MRSEMGTVLRAPHGLQPRFYEPFVIVESRLRLQAVSYHAEVMLAVDEPAAVDVTLEEFLMCRNDQDQLDLSGLVRRAVGGSRLATRVTMRTVGDPAIEVVARVAVCGPPPAALLILIPLRTPCTRPSQHAAEGRDRRSEPLRMSYGSTAPRGTFSSLDASIGAAPRNGALLPRRVSIRRAGRLQQHGPSGRRRGWGESRRRGGFRPLGQWRPNWNRTVV